MARSGSFRGGMPGLNPFGSSGGFSQYNIGDTNSFGENADEARLYEIEVRWSNGQASDGEYLDALKDAIGRTDEGSTKRISAQNKYDDAVFRIGRANVERSGDPDALIAFDQQALAAMNPDSLRAKDLTRTLAAELAERRSRQYSDKVSEYNRGLLTTQSLLDWVSQTIDGLPAGAPDADNWAATRIDLSERVQSEADTKAFQDYQQGRTTDEQFLAFIVERRNSYVTGSPQFMEWDRRLEDSKKTIRQNAFAEADDAFFNGTAAAGYKDGYNQGGKSDESYLLYIRNRLAKMDPDDPNRDEWGARLATATFSLAEDRIRFDVVQGTRDVSALITFYDNHARTLNAGSAEYRAVIAKRDEARNTDFANTEARLRFAAEYGIPFGPSGSGSGAVGGRPASAVSTGGAAEVPGTTVYPSVSGGSYRFAGRGYTGDDNSATGDSLHSGLDLPAPRGTAVRALADGTVTYAANEGAGAAGAHAIGGGNTVNVRDASGTYQYAHLDRFTVASGAKVKKGDIIGYVGNTGPYSSGYHLHIGRQEGGRWVDPLSASTGLTTPQAIIGALEGKPPTVQPATVPSAAQPGVIAPITEKPPEQQPNRAGLQKLADFYKQQVDRFTPGTREYMSAYADWQNTLEKLNAPGPGADPQAIGPNTPRVPVPTTRGTIYGIDTRPIDVARQISIDADSSPFAVANFEANLKSIERAHTDGAAVWAFIDPANPNQIIQKRDHQGNIIPGQVEVASQYLPVSDSTYASIAAIEANYYTSLYVVARDTGNNADAQELYAKAKTAEAKIGRIDQAAAKSRLKLTLEAAQKDEERAWRTADLPGVRNAKTEQIIAITQLLEDPNLDDNTRARLEAQRETIGNDPIFPNRDPSIPQAAWTPGAFDEARSLTVPHPSGYGTIFVDGPLNPGHHVVFDTKDGRKTFTHVVEDLSAPMSWSENHVPIQVKFGDRVVTADATLDTSAPVDPKIRVSVDGTVHFVNGSGRAKSVSFFDESYRSQTAYSFDGQTWIRSNSGALPWGEINVDLRVGPTDPVTGKTTILTADGREAFEVYIPEDPSVPWTMAPGDLHVPLGWYGQAAAQEAAAKSPFGDANVAALVNRGATKREIEAAILASKFSAVPLENLPTGASGRAQNVGGPGEQMTLAIRDPETGGLNMLPPINLRFSPEAMLAQTGRTEYVTDLLGVTREQAQQRIAGELVRDTITDIAQSVFGSTPAPDLREPGIDTMLLPVARPRDFSVEGTLAAQLPPTTPPRIEGDGVATSPAPPIFTYPRSTTRTTTPAITTPPPLRPTVTVGPIPGIVPKPAAPVIVKAPTPIRTPPPLVERPVVVGSPVTKPTPAPPKPPAPAPARTDTPDARPLPTPPKPTTKILPGGRVAL